MPRVTMEQAKAIVLQNLPDGAEIVGAIEHQGKYLFLAPNPDPIEGHLDPFFSVDKITGAFRDFSPQDYPDPLTIINLLSE